MRIGAVIAIADAHDARNAASRLTVPVSDGSCRARILARLRPRLAAADAGLAGRRLASARPPHFPVYAEGRRHDRTSRTVSVSVSGSRPCRYRAALVP